MGNCCSGQPPIDGTPMPDNQWVGPSVTAGIPVTTAQVNVGVDFGTSCTGYAYSINGHQIQVQNSWPEHRAPKTPSLLLYKVEDGKWTPIAWGMAARNRFANLPAADIPKHVLVHSFKLWLRSEKLYQNATQGMPAGCPRPLTIISDYLRFMGQHLNEQLQNSLGKAYDPGVVKYCLTVPAGWTNDEKQSMRKAAAEAGLVDSEHSGRLSLVYEPEAAAVTATFEQALILQPGESFMVLDAGGGTVDITIHDVHTRDTGSRVLKECSVPQCLIQGSTILDRHFELYMNERLGDNQVYKRWRQQYPKHHVQFMTREWENHKIQFTGGQGQGCILKLEMSLVEMLSQAAKDKLKQQSGGYMNEVALNDAEMAALFDKVVNPIVSKVQEMIHQAPRYPAHILLTGGLGSSKYLLSQLRKRLSDNNINIVTPDFGYTAVVQGAVLHGQHPDTIMWRCSQQTYGIKVYGYWQDGMPEAGVLDPATQQLMVKGAFQKMVELGQVVKISDVVATDVSPVDKAATKVMIDVYSSEKADPLHVEEEGVTHVGSVEVPINVGLWRNVDNYIIRVSFRFGGAEIGITAEDLTSKQKAVHATVNFKCISIDNEVPLW